MTRPEPNDMIAGVNEIILANKNASAVQIQESVKEKGFSGGISSAMLGRGDSLSLTGSLDLHNYVEVRDGRLTRPIFLHGLPRFQLFRALKALKFEVPKRMLIVSFEVDVDLLWE
jgi:hypothetical protein